MRTGGTATDPGERITALLATQRTGAPLQQEFYADPDIFARDVARLFLQRWLCVGHESRIAKRGDWFRFDVADESLVVVRGRDGEIRALVNVCRHRGSRVCYDAEGHSSVLQCPYHAWTYGLDGSLRSARLTEPDFDLTQHGLVQARVRVIEGLVFVCFADDPPGLDDAEETLRSSLHHYGWADAQVAHRETYSVRANWKLAVENYRECYHCAPAHPEFSRFHASEKPDAQVAELRAEARARMNAQGFDIPDIDRWPAGRPGQEGHACYYDALYPGAVTGSEDGSALAPLMGEFTDYDGGFCYADVGPTSYFLAYPDHGVMYLFIPREPQRTEMEIVWLVKGGAKQGVDYDCARLTWLWQVTTEADKLIIDQNQQGVNSRYYRPSPYAPMETDPRRFVAWYLDEIAL